MSKREENYQGFIVSGHPLGDLRIQVYDDKIVVKCDNGLKCTVPLNHESLYKLQRLEEECASSTLN